MKEPVMGYEQHQIPRSDTPRSARVASLSGQPNNIAVEGVGAPVGGPPAGGSSGVPSATNSRRGSQTPISPADRNFLLSYLESMSSKAR